MFLTSFLTPLSVRSTRLITNCLGNIVLTHQTTLASLTLKSNMATSSLTQQKYYERLPKNVIPELYKLELHPNLEKFTFSGKEDIQVLVKESTNQIILNASELEIQAVSFKDESGNALNGQFKLDEKYEKVFINFNENLKTGSGVLSLTFSGILNDRMKGFYRSKYSTPTGEERYAATTQFEAPDARRAFPCWDEPAFKAKFEVKISAPKDRTVLSNTNPVEETQHPDDSNLKIVKFSPTPIMSTYLLAFIVGEYDYLETFTERKTRIRVYTPVGKKEQGSFALEVAEKSLNLFEDYFKITFPLEKLDHIGIPDFASGAMENWGLVTYREERILADPQNTSSATREAIAITIAHETAHQWFGNLVTMEWWTDLWLNEGFASFMEYLAVDKIFPQYNIWSQFVTCACLPAFQLDSLRNSHPIEVPVNHPDEIDSIFDLISYEKGASVIRMCHEWIGDEAFRKGLNQYLIKHSYSNAVTQNLWDALEQASGKPVGKTMPYWTKQKGYPVVSVESKRDGNNTILKLTQKLFTVDGILSDEESKVFWMIPISVVTSQDPDKVVMSTLMTSKSTELVLPNVSADAWIKLNPKMTGFYRVNYTNEMLEALRSAIATKSLGPVDRLQVLNDTFALLMAGQASSTQLFKLLKSYVDEDDYVTWVAIDNCIGKLTKLIDYTDYSDKFAQFSIDLYSKIHEKLGFESKNQSSHTESLLRSLVLSRLSSFKHPSVVEESTKRFKAHVSGAPINPDIRAAVYRCVSSTCDDETFNSFFDLFRKCDLVEEKVRLVYALGATKVPERIRKLFEFALSSEVRYQDAWRFIISATGSKDGREEAWKFFKDNATEFKKRYGSHHANAVLIEHIISDFATDIKAKEIEDFFIQNSFSGHESVVLRGLESIKINANWLNRDAADVEAILNTLVSK